MNLQPILKSDLVTIIPLQEGDFEGLYQIAKDPKIWEQHPCKRYKRDEFEKFFRESMASKGALLLKNAKTDQVIGSSRYKPISGFQNGIEIGWTFLSRDHWGGTYNREVKHLMMQHAFTYVDHIVFYVDSKNLRSQKAVEKIGGVLVQPGEFDEIFKTDPNYCTFVVKRPET